MQLLVINSVMRSKIRERICCTSLYVSTKLEDKLTILQLYNFRFLQSEQIRPYFFIWLNSHWGVQKTHTVLLPGTCTTHFSPAHAYCLSLSLSFSYSTCIHPHTHTQKMWKTVLYRKNQPYLAINQPVSAKDILSWWSSVSQSQSHPTVWEPDNMLCVCVCPCHIVCPRLFRVISNQG